MDNKNYEEVEDIVEFTNEEGDLFIMHVNSFTDENGEEMEEFESPDDELLPALIEAAKTKFDIVDLDEE